MFCESLFPVVFIHSGQRLEQNAAIIHSIKQCETDELVAVEGEHANVPHEFLIFQENFRKFFKRNWRRDIFSRDIFARLFEKFVPDAVLDCQWSHLTIEGFSGL